MAFSHLPWPAQLGLWLSLLRQRTFYLLRFNEEHYLHSAQYSLAWPLLFFELPASSARAMSGGSTEQHEATSQRVHPPMFNTQASSSSFTKASKNASLAFSCIAECSSSSSFDSSPLARANFAGCVAAWTDFNFSIETCV